MRHPESLEQMAYFTWLRTRYSSVYEIATANAAGGKRNAKEAARMKREGVKAGFPDIAIYEPVTPYHGLFIELKAPKGRPSKLQIKKVIKLNERGYCAGFCYGWVEAAQVTAAYLEGDIMASHPKWIYRMETERTFSQKYIST